MPYTMTDDDRRRCDLLAVAAREAINHARVMRSTQIRAECLKEIGRIYCEGWDETERDFVRELAHSLGPDARLADGEGDA